MLKKLYSYLQRRWLPYFFAYTAKFGLHILLRTCRIEIQGLENLITAANQSPCILSLWHNRLAIVSEILNTFAPQFAYTAFVSKSRDGEPLALLAKSYKIGNALRVPHNARHRALGQMIASLKKRKEIILITPDGPRGPSYVVKPGVIVAARETEANVIPFSWEAEKTWRLNTWDKMMIPKPFTKLKVIFGPAVTFSKEMQQDLQQAASSLQASMQAL